MDEYGDFFFEEDKMGMTVTSGSATLTKDPNNLIGISIGGGAPGCPCVYTVQIFDNTPAHADGSLEAGDEITGVNRKPVRGMTKTEVAKMIQHSKTEVTLQYNKLHADPKQGKTLDIIMKKMKHKIVENMSSSTADALGLSRAILCNDSMVKKLEELEKNAALYKGLMEHTKKLINSYFKLARTHRAFGDIFMEIGTREPQMNAGEAFTIFGDAHRNMEKNGVKLVKILQPIFSDLSTYLNKAIPDTKLTIKKYLDVKFEYLSYCLKIKEMDDEEAQFNALQEPLYRVETGNYEYRLCLRCRQDARARFAKLRSDVMVKMELLDQKHVQDIVFQLQRFTSAMARYHEECKGSINPTRGLFPIEVDLSQVSVKYNTTGQLAPADDDEYDEPEQGVDILALSRGGGRPNEPPLMDLGQGGASNGPSEGRLANDLFGGGAPVGGESLLLDLGGQTGGAGQLENGLPSGGKTDRDQVTDMIDQFLK